MRTSSAATTRWTSSGFPLVVAGDSGSDARGSGAPPLGSPVESAGIQPAYFKRRVPVVAATRTLRTALAVHPDGERSRQPQRQHRALHEVHFLAARRHHDGRARAAARGAADERAFLA